MIILDGDKKKKAEEVVRKYNESNINASKFKVCNTLDEVREVFKKKKKRESSSVLSERELRRKISLSEF